jgi:hypothetical protein
MVRGQKRRECASSYWYLDRGEVPARGDEEAAEDRLSGMMKPCYSFETRRTRVVERGNVDKLGPGHLAPGRRRPLVQPVEWGLVEDGGRGVGILRHTPEHESGC